ncbi:MAG: 4Fe-4S dicluster domain-containing protein [Eubacteriales bacterium]|nr:4Fe-4S dicluster domain-containing protein [Eubacteriales bacterium]MDD3199302.1 4Fe-4S dicluster domain-containing protein [Eubacteriales bacterium]MDD4121301.1 4Fe-4S dicluster domain-containing protein [Eubacteriales bacterium]MDD4629432.1 4Fe-4S dicluster domain-containing protein [Eubacteriales bacterium]
MASFKLGRMVMRSLFKKPATLMYPVIQREWQERTRGHIENEIDECIFCGICQKKCPANALTVDKISKSWTIARMQCIQCSCCIEVCPKKCLKNMNIYTSPSTEKVVDRYVGSPQESKPVPKAAPEEENEAVGEKVL